MDQTLLLLRVSKVQRLNQHERTPDLSLPCVTTERSQKVWGPNSRSQQFNKFEMKRQPVLDGTSHTAGFDKKGKSKT